PAVGVTNLTPGQTFVVGASVIPTIVAVDAQDPNPTITAWLDGASYAPGTPITAEGHHSLTIRAVDANGNVGISEPCWFEILPFPRLSATCVIESFSCVESGPWADLQATILLAASQFDVQDIALYSINLWALNADGLPLNRKPIPIAGSRDPLVGGYNYSTTQAVYQNGYWRIDFAASLADQALIGCPVALRITGTGRHGQSSEFDLEGETPDVNPSPNPINQLQQQGLLNGDPPSSAPVGPQWPACKWKSKIVKKSDLELENRSSDTSCAYPQRDSVYHYAGGERFGGTAYAVDAWCFGAAAESSSVTGYLIMKVFLEGPDDCCDPNIEITAVPSFKAEVSVNPPASATAAASLTVKSTIGTDATAGGGVSEGGGGAITLNLGAGVTVGKDGPGGGANIGITTTYTGEDQNDVSPQGTDTDDDDVSSATIVVGSSSKLKVKADGHALNVYAQANASLSKATPDVIIVCTCRGGCGATKTFTIK
ncbi:MAG: hypothetical protein CMJ83_17035, partial [Planctomycetes bacterium]|nr:hypothetical protein [Planctomycetota bacterium]